MIDKQIRIVRYGELRPCRTAFIDAHTPGSDQKENFTIIGGGVSEAADQFVHIRDTPGFNIGAAGQPPRVRNSLHVHRTAEVFFVHSGRWRFFWGRWGTAGEVILEPGDLIDIPTGVFRGFENVGADYGMIMAILGGDDAGGGVLWAPQVIEDASAHGLVLSDAGKLYDTKKGQSLPDGAEPMPVMTADELARCPETSVADIVPDYIARYQDMMALAAQGPARVIGTAPALIVDRPGFEVTFLGVASLPATPIVSDRYSVLMIHRGHWRLDHDGTEVLLGPGDTCAVPPGVEHMLAPSISGEAALFRVRPTDDPPGPTRQ